LAVHAMSMPAFSAYDELKAEVAASPFAQGLLAQVAAGSAPDGWSTADDLLLFRGKIFVPDDSSLWQRLLAEAHEMGHEGVEKTAHRLRASFYNAHLLRRVRDFVRGCAVCQRNKSEHLHPAGLLQPLPMPHEVWSDIAMDFVEGFPKVGGKSVVLTVVDRFSKFAHFIALGHPYTAASVARAFFTDIVRLHGFPTSIVSDRDPVFTSNFWAELFRLAGVKLLMSSAFHPQTDGQSEVTNRTIGMYLRCLAGDRPRSWLQWLPWAEFCFNSSYQTALRATPFQVVYGRPPPALLRYSPGLARVAAVDRQLRDRDEFLQEIRERLLLAQDVMKARHDKHRRDIEFAVGEWAWLRLHHRAASGITTSRPTKLAQRFYGPFQVVERVGTVAYRLQLPANAKIHDVFHVGLLKKFEGTPPTSVPPLPPLVHGRVLPTPEKVIRARLNRGVWQLLVHWVGRPAADASWEPLKDFVKLYPQWQLEDELFRGEGGSVVDAFVGKHYHRRNKRQQAQQQGG